jgi:trans-aconitate 2-methyltransferase
METETSPMTDTTWDPAQYLRHADHRSRPFHDLVDRIPGTPANIVDLGCGPGNTTATLPERWPAATLTGIDSSPQMIDKARTDYPAMAFRVGDITNWTPEEDGKPDLILSNAALQWIPGHADLFSRWVHALPAGGILAFQVPGNFGAPSHTLLAELRTSPRWQQVFKRAGLAAAESPAVLEPVDYLARLSVLGCTVDAWETTYYQTLHGAHPVLDWMLGTGLRPALAALTDPGERADFLAEYSALLDRAYPATRYGTVLPYRRIFVIATSK